MKEPYKCDVDFTVVKLVSKSDGRNTTIRVLPSEYSCNGEIVKVIELESFNDICGLEYCTYVSTLVKMSQEMTKTIKEYQEAI